MVRRIDRDRIGVLVIDVQPFFMDVAFPDGGQIHDSLMVRLEHLLMLADWMDLPTIATFEIPTAENGELPDRLDDVFPTAGLRIEKDYYGSMSQAGVPEAVGGLGVEQIAVAGAETDVCVLQTVLGLLDAGYEVFLLEDCLFTTEPEPAPALRRMYAAGAVPCTLKTMAYELTRCVGDTPWYPEGWVATSDPDTKPFPPGFAVPEKWPPWESKL
jgi:nicotinamidase-related amidase